MGVSRSISGIMRVLTLGLFICLILVVSCGRKKNKNKNNVGSSVGSKHKKNNAGTSGSSKKKKNNEGRTGGSQSQTTCQTSYKQECSQQTETSYDEQCSTHTVQDPVESCSTDIQDVCTTATETYSRVECSFSYNTAQCYHSRKKRGYVEAPVFTTWSSSPS